MQNKRGQVAIFVIIALVIVIFIVFLLFRPQLPSVTQSSAISPISFLTSCIQPDLQTYVNELGSTGGYINPDASLEYLGKPVEYLCYTSENYKTCIVQQPLLTENFEKQLNILVSQNISNCVQSLQQEYINQGYQVSTGNVSSRTVLSPKGIIITINAPITATKAGVVKSFGGFNIQEPSEMYDLTQIATSIVSFESTYGDMDPALYARYYPDLVIKKIRFDDGSKVYIINDVTTNETFQFATRSQVWPPGYTA